MKPPPDAPRANQYWHLLRRGWIAIVVATALSAGAGWQVWHHERISVATVKFLILTPAGAQPSDAFYGNLTSLTRTLTYQQLARSPQITSRAIDSLQSTDTPAELAATITVLPTQSAVFDMQVSAEEPEVAIETANALATSMIQVSDEIQRVDTSATQLVLIDPANGAADVRGPLYERMLSGGLLGLVVSALLVLVYGLATGSVTGRRQIAVLVGNAYRGRRKK